DEIRAINARAAEDTVERGRSFDERDLIPVRAALAAFDEPATLLTYEAHEDPGAVWEAVRESALRNEVPDLGAPLDLRVQHFGRYEPSLLIVRPLEYAIPPGHDNVIENLRAHGVVVEPVSVPRVVTAEVYEIERVARAEREFQGVRGALVDARPRRTATTI